MAFNPLERINAWLNSDKVNAQQKAEVQRIFNDTFNNSPVGKALNERLLKDTNRDFGTTLSEAAQIADLQTRTLAASNKVTDSFLGNQFDRVGDLNERNTDLRIRQGSAGTSDRIRELQARAQLAGVPFDKLLSQEKDIYAMQLAENARNREYDERLATRNDGLLKVATIFDSIVKPLLGGYIALKG